MDKSRIIAAAAVLAGGAGLLAIASEAQAAQIMTRTCNVDQVGVYTNRIHIKCAPIQTSAYTGQITYYAMAISSDARVIDNVIALAIGAKQTNKPLVIQFDMDDYRSVPGCQGHDCRKLTGAALE